jgi:hypothetical protein
MNRARCRRLGPYRQAAFFAPTVANGTLRTWQDLQLAPPSRDWTRNVFPTPSNDALRKGRGRHPQFCQGGRLALIWSEYPGYFSPRSILCRSHLGGSEPESTATIGQPTATVRPLTATDDDHADRPATVHSTVQAIV